MKGRPYLIYTHDYRHNSGGIRALHKLCYGLRLWGLEAYVMPGFTNAEWDTPIADEGMQQRIAKRGIVVYPEVEDGNPLDARHVARFVLNVPGRIRKARFTEDEKTFAYCGLLTKYLDHCDGLLTVPLADRRIFGTDPMDTTDRHGVLYWVGKGADVERAPETEHATEITPDWPKFWHELADLFRGADLFISYQPYSTLTIEARLCGCPTVVIPNQYWTRDEFCNGTRAGMNGMAWGPYPPEVERARETVSLFPSDYHRMVSRYYMHLHAFIRKTQDWSAV